MMKLTLLHLFPELLNLYGDRGNIKVFEKRCRLRNIELEVISLPFSEEINLTDVDIVYLGGASEKDLPKIAEKLKNHREELLRYRDEEGVLLAVATGFPLLGHSFVAEGATHEGLGLIPMTTEAGAEKLIGNVAVDSPLGILAGFENHTGRTRLAPGADPLGTVLSGHGNNGEDQTEGAIVKSFIGTHLSGPLLPKNPEVCDLLIGKAIQKKYGSFPELAPIACEHEKLAKGYVLNYGNRTHKR